MATATSKFIAYLLLPLCLACAGATLPVQAAEPAEIALWESVRDSGSSAELRLFLKTFPSSRFAPLAKLRLRRLAPNEQPASETAVAPSSKPDLVPPVPPHKKVAYAGFQIRVASSDLLTMASPSYRPKIHVLRVFPFGQAARAGILVGDTIVSVNGQRPASLMDFIALLHAAGPGGTMNFNIERGGKDLDIAFEASDRFAVVWEAAHRGDSLAMSFLADDYLYGSTVDANQATAARWIGKASATGDAYALFARGYYAENNRLIERSDEDARKAAIGFYLRSADGGDADAARAASRLLAQSDPAQALLLAEKAYVLDPGSSAMVLFNRMEEQKLVSNGGISRDTLLVRAAEAGNTVALRRIGFEASKMGLSAEQAFGLIRRAAVWGDAPAQLELGKRYENGLGTRASTEAALTWYRKAAMDGFGAVRGEARSRIGLFYYHGTGVNRDPKKAYQWFEAASADDNVLGHFYVAYLSGRGEETALDQNRATVHFLKAAELGDTDAMVNLGHRYLNGTGTSESGKKAARWFKSAVEGGDVDGHCGLGDLSYYGKGGYRQSYEKAAEAYRTGSDKGSAPCQFDLGFLHENGLGVRQSRTEAIRLYRLAADKEERAVDRLKDLGVAIFNPEEIQKLLSDLGYDPGPIDGKPGKRTRTAIRAFQQSQNLAVDGEPSASLLDRLRATASPARTSNRREPVSDGLDDQDARALAALKNVGDI